MYIGMDTYTHACVCAYRYIYVWRVFVGAHSGQQRALGPLEMELQGAVSCWEPDFWKTAGARLSHLSQSLWPSLLSSLLLVLSLFFWVNLFPPYSQVSRTGRW